MKYLLSLIFAMTLCAGAAASPGAHGPNGEHLDGPAASVSSGGVPRLETFSEAFELVAQLSGGELSVMIDRYETNEPVLNGTLEVEYKGLKAPAKFHADMGDYAIDDPAFLKAISAPGKHPLLFTLVAGDESDLLEGTLDVSAAATHAEHGRPRLWIGLGLALAAVLIAALALRARRHRKKATP